MTEARIAALDAMLVENPDDTFALYALAMELRGTTSERALMCLRRVTALEPGHHYAYYQLGSLLLELDRTAEAKDCLMAGLDRARADQAQKAASELAALLDTAG